MNYYRWHIGDYRRDTVHLTLLEHGVYRQLLDTYYLNEEPIPLDEAIVMRTHCARTAEEMQAVRNVLSDFFVKTEKGWVHKHCESVIAAYREKSEKASKSASARWQKKNSDCIADAMRSHSEGNANHKPITNNQDITPHTPQGGLPGDSEKPSTRPKTAIAIETFLANCKASGEKFVPPTDPVFAYADEIGLPEDLLHLCWLEFVDRNRQSGKRYKDWRAAFRNCVRGNWYKLWWADADGHYQLTTTGVQAQRKHREVAA